MKEKIFEILKEHSLSIAAPIPLSACTVKKRYKLDKAGFEGSDELFAIMLAIPYLTRETKRNVSAYAVSRDYHLFFKQLFSDLLPKLEETFPQYRFAGFADDSPIDERDAAAKAGLGIIGDNGMLITEKYSSYVFLGEIITDMHIECEAKDIERCRGCGVCKSACPMQNGCECLSALTQKKGELTSFESEVIKKHGTAWGCDRCQEICPHTLRAIKSGTIFTDIEFFKNNTVAFLTSRIIEEMSDEEFALRAYSWRGRNTIARNLKIMENNDKH